MSEDSAQFDTGDDEGDKHVTARPLSDLNLPRRPKPVDRNDLDETRRLIYMAIAAGRKTPRYELVGTLVNALAHHDQGVWEGGPGVLMSRLINVVEGEEEEAWALADKLTAKINGEPT